jgi:hypothetical protein
MKYIARGVKINPELLYPDTTAWLPQHFAMQFLGLKKRGAIKTVVKEDFEKVVSYIDGTSTLPVCVFQLVPKTPEEAVRLRKILSRNYLFSELATGQLDNVVEVCLSFEFVKLATSLISQVMKPLKFSANQDVIRQGDIGKHLYVLVNGHCQVALNRLPSNLGVASQVLVDGKLLAEYFETGCFGELALVYNAPRAATVRTTEESDLYSLDVGSFRHVLREQAGARIHQ